MAERRGAPKAVEKIDRQGRVLERYLTIEAAANENYMCRPSVVNRCLGLTKKCWVDGVFTFRFAGEKKGAAQ